MKFVPGYMFKVAKAKLDFKLGETYRVYHICPNEAGVEYIFQSSGGNIKRLFESTEHAETLITRMAGK
jgi:hypothetical protein|tara:strand:- start:1195 stop:1398 length:204 start_codon:yes stop_codon:yes gene_type:complete